MDKESQSIAPELADVETSSASYAARFAGPVGRWMLERQERLVMEGLREAGARSVLDVGGGHGQLAHPLAAAGFELTVLGSETVCMDRITDLVMSGKCRFVVGSVVALPFPDRSFDAVVTVRLLPHCARWNQLIRECARVARRVVILDYPLKSGLNALAPLLFGAKRKLEKNTRTWRNFKHREVARAFAAAGFAPAGRSGQFFWPMVLHRSLKNVALSSALEGVPEKLGMTRRFGTPVIARFERAADTPSRAEAAKAPD